jgi:hypothetical protein
VTGRTHIPVQMQAVMLPAEKKLRENEGENDQGANPQLARLAEVEAELAALKQAAASSTPPAAASKQQEHAFDLTKTRRVTVRVGALMCD